MTVGCKTEAFNAVHIVVRDGHVGLSGGQSSVVRALVAQANSPGFNFQ